MQNLDSSVVSKEFMNALTKHLEKSEIRKNYKFIIFMFLHKIINGRSGYKAILEDLYNSESRKLIMILKIFSKHLDYNIKFEANKYIDGLHIYPCNFSLCLSTFDRRSVIFK